MIFRIPVLFILLFCFINPSFGNRESNIIDTVFIFIYNQQFSAADSILAEQNGQMESFYLDILNIELTWWKYIHSQSETDLQRFNNLLENLAEKSADPESKINQLIILSYKLRCEFMRYNIFGAIRLRSQIKQLLENIDPDGLNYTETRIKLFHLYSNLFDYFDNIMNPLLLESKRIAREKALLTIETYAGENDVIISTLAGYFLGKIYLNIERDSQKGKNCFRELTERYPRNVIFSDLLNNSEKKS